MATRKILSGWNIDVGPGPPENGQPTWVLRLTEKDTGNVIVFQHNDEVRAFLVKRYSGLQVATAMPSV
jgi:hypothetical protein